MSGRRLGLLAAVAFAVVVTYVTTAPIAAPTPPRDRATRTGPSSVPAAAYPHLANYNGLRYASEVPFFATYDLVIARRGAPVHQLKRVNPRVTALLYERTLQADLCCLRSLYGLATAAVPPGWWLVTAGSRLARAISARQQWIPVIDPRRFARCQDVLVDGESMHVWSVRGHLLHVLRGYYSAPRPHRAGARVAPHYSYRSDLSNCRLSGPAASVRPWSLNLSTRCPRWRGQTWADYLAHRMALLVRREGWDGVFYDNVTDLPPSPLIDVNDDGRPDGGILDGVDEWRAGERALLAETRRLLPRARLMVNGDLRIDGVADGREMEGFPLIPGLAVSAAIDTYLYDGAHGAPLTIVNADSVARSVPNMPAVQMDVGAALLGDGYAAYDFGWMYHGWPWWFDEYDGGAGSASLQPIDAAAMLVPVAHPNRFHRGDMVLFDMEAARVLRVLHGSLLLQRGVADTLPAWHETRTVLATPAQRVGGRGYLGRALGPARLVPTGLWDRYLLPLSLVRGPALLDGHGQRAGLEFVGPHTMLALDAPMHYDPAAVQVILRAPPGQHGLRTLVFTARGPSGASFTVDEGHVAVPLVLRGAWHRYVLPIMGTGAITLGFGRAGGHVELRDLRLVGVQAFVLRRDFARGAVVVNPTDTVQRVVLGWPYRILAGDQDPWANSGLLTPSIPVARYRAVILLNK